MAQFYCLSVMLSILCGLILIYNQNENLEDDSFGEGAEKKTLPGLEKIQEGLAGESLFSNELFKLVCGALCFVTGFVIFFVPYHGISVIGDLLPALVCLLAGACVLLEYFEEKSDSFVVPEVMENIFVANKLYIGIASLFVGVIHFVLPGVPLL
ncbi:MAG: hypothetical protein J6X95_01800 [Treponema sp.]|jgi:hypothetical protein|nr:hypothetical protein [Treponema sp.]